MTRLTEKDIAGQDQILAEYDQELRHKTGLGLAEIACLGAGVTAADFARAGREKLAAVVPVTAGLGVIGGFTGLVRGIARFLGFRTLLTTASDVAGLYEAVEQGADLVFLADDNRFICLNLRTGQAAENGTATGRGFAAALLGLAGGVAGREVLVLGAGPVGRAAMAFLGEQGAKVAVYDPDGEKAQLAASLLGAVPERNLADALARTGCILDASPQGGFLTRADLRSDALLSCPGVPLALADDAFQCFRGSLVHDPLQIGVATMLALACRDPEEIVSSS